MIICQFNDFEIIVATAVIFHTTDAADTIFSFANGDARDLAHTIMHIQCYTTGSGNIDE